MYITPYVEINEKIFDEDYCYQCPYVEKEDDYGTTDCPSGFCFDSMSCPYYQDFEEISAIIDDVNKTVASIIRSHSSSRRGQW